MNQIKPGQRIEHVTANRPHGTVFAVTPEYIGIRWDDGQIDFNKLNNEFETQLILQALRVSGGNK